MILKKIKIGSKNIEALVFELSSKKLIVLKGRQGYVMCGYLNLKTANKFKDIAVKIVGVDSLNDALKAKVFACTIAAKKIGIRPGQPIKKILKMIA